MNTLYLETINQYDPNTKENFLPTSNKILYFDNETLFKLMIIAIIGILILFIISLIVWKNKSRIFLLITLIITMILSVIYYKNSTYYKIDKDDIEIKEEIKTNTINLNIKPKQNINEITITLIIKNSNEEIVYENTLTKIDLKYNKNYIYSFEYEFDWLEDYSYEYLYEGIIRNK